MSPLLVRSSVRFYGRHGWQALLTLAGIILGVAVVIAVDLANASARRAFDLSQEALAGRTTHRINGGPSGIPESVFTDLRTGLGLQRSAPVVSDYVRVSGRSYTLLGIDPLSELVLGRHSLGIEGASDLPGLMDADTVLLATDLAATLQVAEGGELLLDHRGRLLRARVGAIFSQEDGALSEGVILADIAVAQELLERVGTLDRIDLVLDDDQAAALTEWLPAGLNLLESESRDQSLRRMTDNFHLNLTAMSLLALLVGGLLIYNTMTFSVLRRRQVWGICRTLGATGREILALILLEALVFALVGTVLGLGLGVVLAHGLVGLVLGTVDDLYFVLAVREFYLAPQSLLKGVGLGLGITLLSVLVPALEAAKTPPASVLRRSHVERRARARVPVALLAGMLMMALGWGLSVQDSHSVELGFVALALLTIGFCVLVPPVVAVVVSGIAVVAGTLFGPLARMMLRGIEAGLSRTGLALAALSVAVAATVGMGIMVASFRTTLDTWLLQSLSGDIYISLPGPTSERPGVGLSPEWLQSLAQLPGVAAIERHRLVRVEAAFGPVQVLAVDGIESQPGSLAAAAARLPLKAAVAGASERLRAGEGVLVSEPLAFQRDIELGAEVTFEVEQGAVVLPVLGIFRDFRSPRGVIAMDRSLYRQLWNDDGVSGLALYGDGSRSRPQLLDAVRKMAALQPREVQIYSSAAIRERSMALFERTFAITAVLRLLTVLVAFIGIFGALTLVQLERMRELAVLRATGMTARQITLLVLGQTALMGLMAGLLALPLGLLMADVLIHVINLRAFGWTLTAVVPPRVLLEAMALALSAALLVGCYPAWRAGRVAPARLLREE